MSACTNKSSEGKANKRLVLVVQCLLAIGANLSQGRATIGQVWNRHFHSSRACPTAFLA